METQIITITIKLGMEKKSLEYLGLLLHPVGLRALAFLGTPATKKQPCESELVGTFPGTYSLKGKKSTCWQILWAS